MALLFDRDVKTIGKHINTVFNEGELDENAVVANLRQPPNIVQLKISHRQRM